MAPPILVVDDDRRTVDTVELYLRHAGFDVLRTHDGIGVAELVRRERPALVVLDVMLPGRSGLDVCQDVRRESGVPIIMLTARTTEDDTLRGLALGADDYVTKPFSPRELVARVHAVLRRHGGGDVLGRGPLQIHRQRREVTLDGETVKLTATEFDLLELMAGAPGRVYTRAQLVDHLRHRGDDCLERTVDAHVMNIRRKIEPDRTRPQFIVTVYGVGYRFDEPERDA
jgi:two-component system alkaline phosphatase synthesis response regulator PhoP